MKEGAGDFSRGAVWKQVLRLALPLTVAELVQLLYNIVDRIYLGHMGETDSLALTGVGLVFPVVSLIGAFTSLFSSGGAPLFAMARGAGKEEEAGSIQGQVCTLLVSSALILTLLLYALMRPALYLLGASDASYPYARDYLAIYLTGTLFSMLATGLNPFISAQGSPRTGMMTTLLGAVANLILDPLFIFALNMGVRGAALATVLSQALSFAWVMRFFLSSRALLPLKRSTLRLKRKTVGRILSLGVVGFVMKFTNSLVQIACNTTLQQWGGDLYVGVMTIVNSVRDILSLPVSGISGGAQPVISYNYGAREYGKVRGAIRFMSWLSVLYTLLTWGLVMLIPAFFISMFSPDPRMLSPGQEALHLYFIGFCFQAFQFSGQCAFQALGDTRHALFFSLLRKVVIVVPLTFLLPAWGLGVSGVFLAEPISNAVGGMACYLTMYFRLYKPLEKRAGASAKG